jgi:anti-sigma B factor antagonist
MLKVHVQKLEDVALLRLRGRIVFGATETLRDAVDSQLDASAVVLDLARVSAVDAGGLGVLLELREQLQSRGIEFKLINVTRRVRQVLEIARLDSVFETFSEAESLPEESRGQPAAAFETAPCA